MPRDACSLLVRLLDVSEGILTLRRFTSAVEIEELAEEVTSAAQRVSLDVRLIDHECTLLMQVLRMNMRAKTTADTRTERLTVQLVGVLLPAIREALGRAIDDRRSQQASAG